MFNNIINGSCEDIHRVNLPLYACGAMQLPPYQLLRIFGGIFGWTPRWDLWKGFRKVPDRTLPDEGVAPGALGRTPPSTPT